MNAPVCASCGNQLEVGRPFCGQCGMMVAVVGGRGNGSTVAPETSRSWQDDQAVVPSPLASPTITAPLGPSEANPPPESGSPNETYLGNRLLYRDSQTEFDPLTNPTLLRAIFSRAIVMASIWFAGFAFLVMILMVSTIDSLFTTNSSALSSAPRTSGSSGNTFLGWFFITGIWTIAWGCLFWFAKVGAQVSEWMLPMDGRGAAAPDALDHMYTVIRHRRSPVSSMSIVQFHPNRREQRYYLQVEMGHYRGFVSCFPYGNDLFIGWTYWIHISPAQWLGIIFRRIFRGSAVYVGLSLDDPKAMREMLHNAVREGVDVAIGRIDPQGGGMGSDGDVPVIIAKASGSEAH